MDVLIELPDEEFDHFSSLYGNGQSRLLQAVKSALLTTYPNTRIIDLTVGELMELLETIKTAPQEAPKAPEKRLVYGIAGIAQIFNCSMTTANRIKASGRIDRAIKQNGRIIVVDADLALELYNNNK